MNQQNPSSKRLRKSYQAAEAAAKDNKDFVVAFWEEYYGRFSQIRSVFSKAKACESIDIYGGIYNDHKYLENAKELLLSGSKTYKIMGGYEVNKRDMAECVALGDSNGNYGASGVFIGSNIVLTAAHIDKRFTQVVCFGTDIDSQDILVVRVKSYFVHQYYSSENNAHDLMILELYDHVKAIRPVEIASSEDIDRARSARIAGFGRTDKDGAYNFGRKRAAIVPIASISCLSSVGGQSDSSYYGCINGIEIVAGRPNFGVDSCIGDSGGPLYTQRVDGDWVLAGITSRKTLKAKHECGDGGIYVRVDRYQSWIDNFLNAL